MYDGTDAMHGRVGDRTYRQNRTLTGLVLTTGIFAAAFAAFLVAVTAPGLAVAAVLSGAAAEAVRLISARRSDEESPGQRRTAVPG